MVENKKHIVFISLVFLFVGYFSPITVYASNMQIETPTNEQLVDSDSFVISGTLDIDAPNPNGDKTHYVRLYVNGDNMFLPNTQGPGYKYSTQTDTNGNWTYTVNEGVIPCVETLEINAVEYTETAYVADLLTVLPGPVIALGYFNYLPILGSSLGTQVTIPGIYGGIDVIKTSADGRYAYVSYFDISTLENRLSILDTDDNTEVSNILLAPAVGSIATITAISDDGNTLFVYDSTESGTDFTILSIISVDVSDPLTPSVLGSDPFVSYTALTNEQVPSTNVAPGGYAYLPTLDRETIEVYDVSSGPTGNPVLVGSYSIGTTALGLRHYAAITPDGANITFVNQDLTDVEAGLYTFDIENDPLLTTLVPTFTPVPEGPNVGAYTPDGTRYLLSRGNSVSGDPDELVLYDSSFSVLDIATLPSSVSADTLGIVLNSTGSANSINSGCLLAAGDSNGEDGELSPTGIPVIVQIMIGVFMVSGALISYRLTKRYKHPLKD